MEHLASIVLSTLVKKLQAEDRTSRGTDFTTPPVSSNDAAYIGWLHEQLDRGMGTLSRPMKVTMWPLYDSFGWQYGRLVSWQALIVHWFGWRRMKNVDGP